MCSKKPGSWEEHREDRVAVTRDIWRQIAGSFYEELLLSKARAISLLSNPESDVRIVAIWVCDQFWNCSRDEEFLHACRYLAMHDTDDFVRAQAISCLGKSLESTQDHSTSQFLAHVTKDNRNSERVRKAAYWALRQIQIGLTEKDEIKRAISLAKEASHKLSDAMPEAKVKQALLGGGHFPGIDWDSVDQIDWEFVDQYALEEPSQ